MSFKEFLKELNGNRAEGELIKSMIYSLITSFIILGLLYFKLGNSFFTKYGYFVFFAVLSYAIIIPTIRQVRTYRELPCMAGMMVGMTTGMIAGFLSGFYIASTNGMFVGSLFGMTLGIILGIWNGKCCGIMGIMEGIMAGFMGGLMGAMTAFMLLNDNLKIIAIVVFFISAIIIFGLNYMIYKEMRESARQRREEQFWNIVLTFILTVVTVWFMAFGPKTGVFAGG